MTRTKARITRLDRKATAKSKSTEIHIMDAAVECVNKYGYHRTNMARVSEEAELTRGCLLYYFPSNSHLMKATSIHIVDRMCHKMDEVVDKASELPKGLDIIFEQTLMITHDRYFTAWVELLADARNDHDLNLLVTEGSRRLDLTRKQRYNAIWKKREIEQSALDLVYDVFMLYTVGSVLLQPAHDAEKRSQALRKMLREGIRYVLGFRS